ncbi:MAG: hypothetical protein ACJ8AS_09255 [Hyphomicrobiales bacterium]
MTRTCHIHIGLHKTGSTTIQKMLAAESARLSSSGFYIPRTGMNESRVAHHLIAMEANGEAAGRPSQFETLASELDAAHWPENVILTSEGFSARMHEPEVLSRLRTEIERMGYRPRVIVFVRPQEGAIHSFYTQKLKMWTYKGTFDRYWSRALAKPGWDYEQRFAALFDSGITFRVLPFSRKLIAQGLCRQFLLAAGLPEKALDGLVEPTPSNVSPGPRAIAAIRAVNQELERRGVRANRWRTEKAATIVRRTHDLIGHDDGRFNALTEDVATIIRTQFRESNERFSGKAFGRPWAEVFTDEMTRIPVTNTFDPDEASPDERQEFDAFVHEMADAICEFLD